jgi:hypothetical protein
VEVEGGWGVGGVIWSGRSLELRGWNVQCQDGIELSSGVVVGMSSDGLNENVDEKVKSKISWVEGIRGIVE